MDGSRTLHGFEFDQQFSLNDQVRTKRNIDVDTLENLRNGDLPFNMTSCFAKAREHHRFVCRFEQPRPEITMDFKPAMHRDTGKAINLLMR